MKLTTLFIIVAIMQVSAVTRAQKVTLKVSNAPLTVVFQQLRSQTGYDFAYTGKTLENSKSVTINANNEELRSVLDKIFAGQPLEFTMDDKTVVVSQKQTTIIEKVSNFFAGTIDVRGRVVDSLSGQPLPGATIILKGQTQGTRAGADGTFFLQGVEEKSTLVIKFIGYKTIEIKASKDLGTIRMESSVESLKEVGVTVNTGYQRIKPEQSSGAVSQITTKEYESRINTNFLDGLVNKLPGLVINNNIQFTSTQPGQTSSSSRPLFNIRGIATMSANQDPLIVIDGFPTELTIDMIDPNEVKSVTILKDAAAATIYGVRASNGVIVIERKQATAGKARFTFRTTVGITPKENYSRYRWAKDASAINMNYWAATQANVVNDQTYNNLFSTAQGSSSGRSPVYYILAEAAANMLTPEQASNAFAAMSNYDNLNDYSKLFLRNAVTRTHNFNVSGGSSNALYYITANYTGDTQSQTKNDDNRFSLSGRTTLKLSKRLSLELATDYQEQRSNNAPVPAVNSVAPFEHYQNPDGTPAAIISQSISPFYNNYLMSQGFQDNMYYPLIDINAISDKARTVNNRVTADLGYRFGAGFDLSVKGIYETSRSESRHLATQASSEVKQDINAYTILNTDGTLTYNIPPGSFLQQVNANTTSYTVRAQLNYNKTIGLHSFNAILGGEMRDLTNQGYTTSAFGYDDQTLALQAVDWNLINTGAAGTHGTLIPQPSFRSDLSYFFNQQYNDDRFLSGYANIVYSYKDTYSLTGSVRIDQSNLFGSNPKYKYKPLLSGGFAWNIHKENFLKDVAWINQLKMRASYGFNGNVAKLSLPQVIAQTTQNSNIQIGTKALGLLAYANSSLRWEQTRNLNVGLDFDIFKNISGSFDYYQKNSTDLLGNVLIDPTLGISPTLINQANIRNQGLELKLKVDWSTSKNFKWNTGLNLSRNTSKVLQVYRTGDYTPVALNALGYVQGYPVGAMFGYDYAGLDNTGYPLVRGPGGNLLSTSNNQINNETKTLLASPTSGFTHYVGSSLPTLNVGLNNTVDIGDFTFYTMVNYYGGFKVSVPRPNPSASRPYAGAGNYWKAPGDEQTTDVMSLAAFSSANSTNVYNYSQQSVVNGDYITLADVTLSYRLNKVKLIKNLGISNFEIRAQGSNLYTVGFNKYNFSMGTGSYQKSYVTPIYTLGIYTNF